MLQTVTKIFTLLFLLLFTLSCGSKSSSYRSSTHSSSHTKLNKNDYKIVQERMDFERNQQADMTFEIDKNTDTSLTMLLDAHVRIMYKINLKKKMRNVLYAELISKKRVLFNKLLIEKRDFYFDSVNNTIYLVVSIPYIYLLDGKFKLDVAFHMIDKRRKQYTRNVELYYETKAMKENGEKYMSFKFVDDFNSPNVDRYIKSMMIRELKNSYVPAFERSYKKRHRKIFRDYK